MSESKKFCIACNQEKDIISFRYRTDNNKYKNTCLECEKLHKQKYYLNNKEHLTEKHKEYINENYETYIAYQKQYNEDHQKTRQAYKKDNKERLLKDAGIYYKNKYKTDPVYKMREIVSKSIYNSLRRVGTSKNGSIISFLPYSMQELKDHIEKQFESWMTWDNRGYFDPETWDDNDPETWDDNDPTTWTWQLDHIIPQSDLPYTNMEEDNFKKCWALSNLRPLSSKQNLLDGVKRIRHGRTRTKKTKKNS